MFVCFPGMVGPKEGVLGLEDESAENTQAVLVASPEQKRTARKLRSRAASTAAATDADTAVTPEVVSDTSSQRPRRGASPPTVPAVPIFHCGPLAWEGGEGGEAASTLWPLFFRLEDLETMWREVGGGAPQPPPEATDLAELLSTQGGLPAEAAAARLLLCAPLDAIDFMRSHAAALGSADATMESTPADGDAAALRQVLPRAVGRPPLRHAEAPAAGGPPVPDILDERPTGFDRT